MTPSCHIVPLDRYNWELCLDISLLPAQDAMLPSILYSLAQARFEQLVPMGIVVGEKMIGFLMYGEFGGICWINRIMIDANYQGQGYGTSAITQLISKLKANIRCREIRTSYARNNYPAGHFFETIGFVSIPSELADGEVVMRYEEEV